MLTSVIWHYITLRYICWCLVNILCIYSTLLHWIALLYGLFAEWYFTLLHVDSTLLYCTPDTLHYMNLCCSTFPDTTLRYNTHAYTCHLTLPYIDMHACRQKDRHNTHTNANTYIRACMPAYIPMHACIPTASACPPRNACANMQLPATYLQTHMRKYLHLKTNIYIHTHTHVLTQT